MEGKANQYQVTVIMTEMCNLACTYCYVPHREVPKDIISEDVIDALMLFVQNKIDEGWGSVRIDIFGGEPLLGWEQCVYLIEKADRINKARPGSIIATIFTNATLLTEDILKYTLQKDFVQYNFSVDGNRTCHNQNRVYADGRGSFDDVMRGIGRFCKIYDRPMNQVSMMYMLAPSNIRDHMSIAKSLKASGMSTYYTGLVREDIWTPEDIEIYKEVMNECAEFFINDFDNSGFINIQLLYPHLDHEFKRNTFCGACKSTIGLTPKGDLYPCQRFFNNRSGYKIGDIWNGIDTVNSVNRALACFHDGMIPKCKKCKYGLYPGCMGQCFAACYEASGDMFKVIDSVCQLQKITYDISEYIFKQLGSSSKFRDLVNSVQGG